MSSGKIKVFGLRACLTIALVTTIFIASPTHSYIVQRNTAVNKLCGDERLYFNETRKCYPAKKKGPCGELMVLEPSNADENIGECNCEYIKGALMCPQRPKVLWTQESRCYYIYEQGPCKKGEWVVPHKDAAPSCESIPCPEKYEARLKEKYYFSADSRFVFPHAGKCYQSYSQEGGFCPADEIVYFVGGDSLNLHCANPNEVVCGVSYTPDMECPDHSEPDFQGGCEPVTDL
ncbi:unnamed protein product [Allacma fusca]|uniref:DUF4789 domain-containing protein n=1 Tax=Allacma fusca TaxID=39272 RepID=A0A8J2KW15_9HEXA|nr:unnamed protein product [Allacma fusca]